MMRRSSQHDEKKRSFRSLFRLRGSTATKGAGAGKADGKSGKAVLGPTVVQPDASPRRPSTNSTGTASSAEENERRDAEASPDASIRPITPRSTRTSSVHTSGSQLSEPRTFRSAMTGQSHSTKPTTLFSVETTDATNRIALPTTSAARYAQRQSADSAAAMSRQDSTNTPPASIHFSPLPSSTSGPISSEAPKANGVPSQYPRHTQPDLRRNPAPHSPALDNASMLTLASSTAPLGNALSYAPDENASVRALPPTPARRTSDASLSSSRWSAANVAAARLYGNDAASWRTGPSNLRRDSATDTVGTVPSVRMPVSCF